MWGNFENICTKRDDSVERIPLAKQIQYTAGPGFTTRTAKTKTGAAA